MKKIAIACQGGGSHCAFTGGVLAALLGRVKLHRGPGGEPGPLVLGGEFEIVALSGTSGGAISAYLAWLDLLRLRASGEMPQTLAVNKFWEGMKAQWHSLPPNDRLSNWMLVSMSQLEGLVPMLAPTPNPLTHWVQQQMIASIRKAAGDLDFLGGDIQPGCVKPTELDALRYSRGDFPALLIGAADVDRGEFSPFLATPKRPPLVEQIVASTALPDIFPAISLTAPDVVQDPGKRSISHYWDGLLSQNPPIGDLLFKDFDARPDEIWIVRINPAERQPSPYALKDGPPVTAAEIYDRRNELAGNLSLEQEKRFVRKINKMLADGHIKQNGPARYKPVGMWGIALEGLADMPENEECKEGRWRKPVFKRERRLTRSLGYSSKLLRDPYFLQELHELGVDAVDDFLRSRALPAR